MRSRGRERSKRQKATVQKAKVGATFAFCLCLLPCAFASGSPLLRSPVTSSESDDPHRHHRRRQHQRARRRCRRVRRRACATGRCGIGPLTLLPARGLSHRAGRRGRAMLALPPAVRDARRARRLAHGACWRWSRRTRRGGWPGSSDGADLRRRPRHDDRRDGGRRGELPRGEHRRGRARAARASGWRRRSPSPPMLIARAVGSRGPRLTVSTACSSGANALGIAADWIRARRAPAVLCGGADSLCRMTFSGFNALQALDRVPCRPFDRERAGLTLGEGAAMFVLEDWDARGAPRRAHPRRAARLRRQRRRAPPHPAAPGRRRRDARHAARARRRRRRRRGDRLRQRARHRHAAERRRRDARDQGRARRARLRACRCPRRSRRSATASAPPARSRRWPALLALRDGFVPPTATLREADPECDLDYVPRASRPAALRTVLSNSYGFGGNNTSLVAAQCGRCLSARQRRRGSERQARQASATPACAGSSRRPSRSRLRADDRSPSPASASSARSASAARSSGARSAPAVRASPPSRASRSRRAAAHRRRGARLRGARVHRVAASAGAWTAVAHGRRREPDGARRRARPRRRGARARRHRLRLGARRRRPSRCISSTACSSKGPAAASPMVFPNLVLNAPASYVAMEFGFTGVELHRRRRPRCPAKRRSRWAATPCAAGAPTSSSPAAATRSRRCSCASLHRARALAGQRGGREWASPYDAARSGLVLGEGAAMLVLEPLERARARGAPVYACIDGSRALRRRRAALRLAVARDRGRARRLRRWPTAADRPRLRRRRTRRAASMAASSISSRALPATRGATVTSIKGAIGEFGAAGALTTAAACLALREQMVPPLCHLRNAGRARRCASPPRAGRTGRAAPRPGLRHRPRRRRHRAAARASLTTERTEPLRPAGRKWSRSQADRSSRSAGARRGSLRRGAGR